MTRIKQILAERGQTIYRLHKEVGGNRAQFYLINNGHTRATVPQRERIAGALNVPVEEIFNEDGMAVKGD